MINPDVGWAGGTPATKNLCSVAIGEPIATIRLGVHCNDLKR
jgi:hypothetical protein